MTKQPRRAKRYVDDKAWKPVKKGKGKSVQDIVDEANKKKAAKPSGEK